jgi:N-dimethylarginine dimethylaminohydrolase
MKTPDSADLSSLPAYGGPGWRPRERTLSQELGAHWGSGGVDSEWQRLKKVLLHRPGPELKRVLDDPEGSLMRAVPDQDTTLDEHEALAQAYRDDGVEVRYVDPPSPPPPNQLFVADLMFMTPEGAIVGRPASEVRAGEERWVSRALGQFGLPVLRSVRGSGTFEGADAMWVDPGAAMVAQGLRTNAEGAAQVSATLRELGVEVIETHLPPGTMHLMGQLRIVDRAMAIAWPGRFPDAAVKALQDRGMTVHFLPETDEALDSFALNFVVLGPRRIVLPAGNPRTQAFYEGLGIDCRTVEVGEIGKAAGSIGCLTGILHRDTAAGG